ncbi:uncharacterized protein [Asterias amurensis]|uniref:uncharacterized protein n=1 Tax=Asterias amurensis TaxID=7602 RepID=UPI003AB3283B
MSFFQDMIFDNEVRAEFAMMSERICNIIVHRFGQECIDNWKNGKCSKLQTIEGAFNKFTKAVVKSMFVIAFGFAGGLLFGAVGGVVGCISPGGGTCAGGIVGATLGAVYSGKRGSDVSDKLNPYIEREVAAFAAMVVSRNDQRVLSIENLEMADHVITEDAEGIHAIVCGIDISGKRVTLVHINTTTGVVGEDTVEFCPPWRRVIYRDSEEDTRVVAKAKALISSRIILQEGQRVKVDFFPKWCKRKGSAVINPHPMR